MRLRLLIVDVIPRVVHAMHFAENRVTKGDVPRFCSYLQTSSWTLTLLNTGNTLRSLAYLYKPKHYIPRRKYAQKQGGACE